MTNWLSLVFLFLQYVTCKSVLWDLYYMLLYHPSLLSVCFLALQFLSVLFDIHAPCLFCAFYPSYHLSNLICLFFPYVLLPGAGQALILLVLLTWGLPM